MPKREKKEYKGSDGKPMSSWQIWLRRLCYVTIGWSSLELVLGILLIVTPNLVPVEIVENLFDAIDLAMYHSWMLLGASTLVGAFLNVVIAFLGIRGAENPKRITLFFWIVLFDAVIITWALVSNVSNGIIDPASILSGVFVISLGVCAWEVRKQTGYFDNHP